MESNYSSEVDVPVPSYLGFQCASSINGGFLKRWVSPTTMGFPTKNDHFEVFLGVPPFKETPI